MSKLFKTVFVALALITGATVTAPAFAGPDVNYGPLYPDKYKADRGE